ncbi:MAG: hypothetical protein K0B02_04220 [DPANN group archaeon]|nr:hypothetical protein [DPANN group archaeon]
MDNKMFGIILIVLCLGMGFVVFEFTDALTQITEDSCDCTDMADSGDYCPHSGKTPWQTYFGIFITSAIGALGLYLIFFEKSQGAILNRLENNKKTISDKEKFDILFMGLDPYEKKVMNAVMLRDGITQQTLRYRTDMHKSKLSIVLDGLEKKGIITRVEKGKTKQVFLKIAF